MPEDRRWPDYISIETIDNRYAFGVADALPILLDRLETLDSRFIERIAQVNRGHLEIVVSEEPASESIYEPSLRRAWIFGGTATGFEGSGMGGSETPEGLCIPIAVEDAVIHELVHASDPWLQVLTLHLERPLMRDDMDTLGTVNKPVTIM